MLAGEVIRGQGSAIAAAGVPGAVSIWIKSTKSTWHIPAAEAAGLPDDHPRLISLIAREDLYISPGVRPLGLSSGEAGKQDALVGLGAFAADIDAWSELRAHANLPRTFEDIESIIEAVPFLPSLVVKSGTGHSMHPWWIFTNVQPIDGSSDVTRLKRAAKKFHEPMHTRAAEMGFHLDNTAKLNQWLRLPGSKNFKFPEAVGDVEVIWTGREYDFDELAPDGRKVAVPVPSTFIESESDDLEEGDPPSFRIEDDYPNHLDVYRAVVETARRVRPGHQHKEKIEKILRGESFSESGDRDDDMFYTVSTILFYLDRKNPIFADRDLVGEALIKLYTPSFEVWAAEPTATKSLETRIDKFSQKIIAAFSERDAKDAKKEAQADVVRRALLKTIEIRSDGVPVEALDPSTTIIQHKNAYYVHNFGLQEDHPLPTGYYGPFIKEETIPAVDDFWKNCPNPPFDLTYRTEPTTKNPLGVTKQKTITRLVHEYGSLALEVLGDLSLAKSYYDIKTRVYHKAICPVRDLEPVFDQGFDNYLKVAYGEGYAKFVDYLSYFLQLDRAIGAPYIEGPSGAGKGALVAGLARFWGDTGPSDYERIVVSTHNDFRVPFIVVDEGFTFSRKSSAHIRHLIATGEHTINPKGTPQFVVKGHPRFMFTANNTHGLTEMISSEELSEDDVDAIARRFIYFRLSDDAPRWLNEYNHNNDLTNTWIEGDVIAKHVLWLNQNHRANVVPGKRFVVEGESTEVHRALVTRGDKRGFILEWLAHFATNPTSVERYYATKKSDLLAKIGNGHLLVNTRAVSENWGIYGEKAPCLTTTMIGRILGQISSRVRLNDSGYRVRYHSINFDHVLDWAKGDAQIGDIEKMNEHFNREIEES